MLRYCILVLILSATLARQVEAASAYAGEFLAIGGGARALALGNAYVALVDDATAGYWNPAALSTFAGRQLHLTHSEQFSGLVQQDFLAVAAAGRRIDGYALSVIRVGVDDIRFTRLQDPQQAIGPDNRPLIASTESSADYAMYLSGGKRISNRFSLGASVKTIYRSVGEFSAFGLGLDVGLRYRLAEGLALAANVRDITTTPIAWDNNTDVIHPSALIGLAYSRQVGEGRASLALASRTGGDAVDQSGADPLNAGLEYWYGKLALRAGFEETRQAFGLGIQTRDRLTLDLAYLTHEQLESTYRFSAGIRF